MKNRFFKIMTVALALVLTLGIFVACDNAQSDGGETEEAKVSELAIKANGVTVELGKKADSAIKKLGEPVSKQNTGNCGGLGETTRYDYPSFIMVVVDYEDGGKIIDQIELRNDGAETVGGIYIGSSEADVKAKYGDADETVGGTLIYKDGNKRLEIGISGGEVITIVLRCEG